MSDSNNQSDLLELVRKAIEGNDAAFGQIYDLFFEKIYRFVFYRVNHQQTAEDLVAETFIRAWRSLREIQEAAAFQGWLFQIARNLVIDHYRSRKETVDLETLENVLVYEDNILERTNLTFQHKLFLENLQKLSSDQQLVLKLKFLDDLENREIAKILNKTETAIRVIQHRAINELKQLLNNGNGQSNT